MNLVRSLVSVAAVSAALLSGNAHAALTSFQTYVGNYGVSTDGWGSTSASGIISASVPAGATVKAAYLYTSSHEQSVSVGGTLAGNTVNYASNLGLNNFLVAYRADVTSIVKPLVDGGIGGIYNFAISETQTLAQDGSALVVVYELASLGESTVGILDGFSVTGGDSAQITFASPLNPSAPGFFAEMRLGIGFSYDGQTCNEPLQTSSVSVNNTIITQSAGCHDDAVDGAANGNLITVGGYDDPFSPLLPSVANDHERYNLVPYISSGDTVINVKTQNPSGDDNIFLAVFHVAGRAGVNEPPPPTGVPEPLPMSLLGLGFAALVAQRKIAARRA